MRRREQRCCRIIEPVHARHCCLFQLCHTYRQTDVDNFFVTAEDRRHAARGCRAMLRAS